MSRPLLELLHEHPVPQPRNRSTGGIGWWKLQRLFAVMVAAANHHDRFSVWLSQDTMKKRSGFPSKRDVQDALAVLEELELVAKVGKRQNADLYEVSTSWLPPAELQKFLAAIGQDFLPDRVEAIGQASLPDSAEVVGQEVGQEVGQAALPRTELEPEPQHERAARVFERALAIELRLIPTSVPAERLRAKKRDTWLPVILRALAQFPEADEADLAAVALEELHPNEPRFAVSDSTRLLLARKRDPLNGHVPCSPDRLRAIREAVFPDKFKGRKPT